MNDITRFKSRPAIDAESPVLRHGGAPRTVRVVQHPAFRRVSRDAVAARPLVGLRIVDLNAVTFRESGTRAAA